MEMEPIPVAVVEAYPSEAGIAFTEMLHMLSTGDEPLIEIITVTSRAEAEDMLREEELAGLFILGNEIELVVTGVGNFRPMLYQSILQNITAEFARISATMAYIAVQNPAALPAVIAELTSGLSVMEPIEGPRTNMIQYLFYVLIAMVCLMGSTIGLHLGLLTQSGQSEVAARLSIAPTSKTKVIARYFVAGVTTHFVVMGIFLAYLLFVLGLDLGDRPLLILPICLAGTIASVGLGIVVATVSKAPKNIKEGALTAIQFIMYTLSGLFLVDIRLLVRDRLPLLDMINPMTIIGDAFVSLVLYDSLSHYLRLLGILCVLALVSVSVSIFMVRRSRYADY